MRDTEWAEHDEGFETEFRVRQKVEIDRRFLIDFFFVIQVIYYTVPFVLYHTTAC